MSGPLDRMEKWDIARALNEISRYLELSESNRFKALAFQRAADSLRAVERPIDELIAAGELTATPGIGKATAAVIEELDRTGQSSYLDELRGRYPPGIFDLLRVPGFGLKKIAIVHEKLGVGSLDQLEAAGREGRLAKLPGFGAKTQQKILDGIEKARRRESHFLLPAGLEVAVTLLQQLASIAEVEDAEVSGSVRRRLEVIRNVNVVVKTRDREAVSAAMAKLLENPADLDADTIRGTALGEIDVYIHLASPESFASTLLRTTGTEEFVNEFTRRSGFEWRDGALFAAGKPVREVTEAGLFEKAGLPFVEPERRETAEDLKRKGRRSLVSREDLRGTFHVHTTYSDGRNSIAEMLGAAGEAGLEYVGLSDHSPAAHYAGGLSTERLREQHREIDSERKKAAPMTIFRGTEADILPDGTIDYPAETLATLDFVIASIHSRFGMPKDEMTERLLTALDNPFVTFLGHLTGRKLLARDGYTLDFDRVFERAGQRGVMIEINGNPNRLDLDWRHVRRALDLGVQFSINPDAHSVREYGALLTGSWVARKAGLSPKQIFNTKPADEVAAALTSRSKAAKKALGV